MSGIVKKHLIALFVNDGTASVPKWVRIKKSTELTISLNPVTQEYDYIADEMPTTELEKYNPSLNQTLTMYKGEPDYEIVFKRFFNLATGSEAGLPTLIVFFQEPVDSAEPHKSFLAWHAPNARLVVSDLNAVASTIPGDIQLNGGLQTGFVKIESGEPVFKEGEYKTPVEEPTITQDLATTETTTIGNPIDLTVLATVSNGVLTYAWFKDGVAIIGANSSIYTIDADATNDSGAYHCVITNTLGTETASTHSTSCDVTVS